MVDPSPAQARTSVIVLLLVAVLSGLIVASVYEVRARVAKRHSQRSADEPPQSAPSASLDDQDRAARDGCADLRRRYLLAQCSNDLPLAPASVQPGPAPGSQADQARAASELAVWLNPAPDELGDMARRCEVRFDMPAITETQPPAVTDEASAALSLSGRERALVDQTLSDLHAGLRTFAERAFAETAGQSAATAAAASAPTLEEMLTELQTRPEGGFEEARAKLAAERAGLMPPPARDALQPTGERLLRRWASLGDEFERLLSDKLGSDRAHQMRVSTHAGWMNRFSQAGCRSQPQAASR